MNGPPTVLLRLTRFLGNEPRHTFSRASYRLLLIVGVVEIVSSAWLFVVGDPEDSPLLAPILFSIGALFIAQGAEGLLRESHRGLSLWARVLQTLLIAPLVLLWAAQWYTWWGILGASACALVVAAIFAWSLSRRERQVRESR